MNKTPNNNDFEDLFQIYAESCSYKNEDEKNPEDEEEKLAKGKIEENLEEIEENPEENSEEGEGKLTQEGIFDRVKAKASGIKGTAGAVASNVKNAVGGVGRDMKYRAMGGERPEENGKEPKDVGSMYQDKQTHSILNSHMVKLDKALSGLASDVVKLNVMDADQAEKLASSISANIRKSFGKHNKNKILSSKGRNFDQSSKKKN